MRTKQYKIEFEPKKKKNVQKHHHLEHETNAFARFGFVFNLLFSNSTYFYLNLSCAPSSLHFFFLVIFICFSRRRCRCRRRRRRCKD